MASLTSSRYAAATAAGISPPLSAEEEAGAPIIKEETVPLAVKEEAPAMASEMAAPAPSEPSPNEPPRW